LWDKTTKFIYQSQSLDYVRDNTGEIYAMNKRLKKEIHFLSKSASIILRK